jgi:3-oxoacyl-[acyl-carrier-protein] synthase-1
VSAGGGEALDIIAIGARTPVGITAEESAASVRAGISRAREFPFVDAHGEPVVLATDGSLDAQLEGRERVWALLESALDQVTRKLGGVWRAAGEGHGQARHIHLLLALPEARPGFSEGDAAWIAEATGRRVRARSGGIDVDVTIAGRGHAGAIRAVEAAMRQARGHDDAVWMVGGADSYVHTETFLWLEGQRRFAQAGVRSGFVPGEGAGCLVLATPRLRARLRSPRLAAVSGAATAEEKQLRGSEAGSSGAALAEAVRGAITGVALPAQAADVVYIDINGERYRSEEWGFVALKTPEAFKSLQYRAPSDCWGDVGAAFGTLGAILAVRSYARAYARGPRSLVLAGSDGGLRGAMLVLDPKTL